MGGCSLNFPVLPDGYFWDPFLKRGEETERLAKGAWPSYLSSYGDMEDPPPPTSLTEEEVENRFKRWGILSV